MPTFRPPTTPNRSLEPDDGDMLWKYYSVPDRGMNLLKYTDGTYELTDAWPWVTDGVGKVVTTAYYGAHTYTVTSAEATAITTYLATLGITADIT